MSGVSSVSFITGVYLEVFFCLFAEKKERKKIESNEKTINPPTNPIRGVIDYAI